MIPIDNDIMTERYACENGGICGQACLAYIQGKSIREVLHIWAKQGLEWRGWSGWNQLASYLKTEGYSVKRVPSKKKIQYNQAIFYIARVQWIGENKNRDKPFYGWPHWSVASANTHFIVLNHTHFFCNCEGRLHPIEHLDTYMIEHDGVITSLLEVRGPEQTVRKED